MDKVIYITPEGRIELPAAAVEYSEHLAKAMDRIVDIYGYTGGEVAAGAVIYAAMVNKLNARPGHEQNVHRIAIEVYSIIINGRRERIS